MQEANEEGVVTEKGLLDMTPERVRRSTSWGGQETASADYPKSGLKEQVHQSSCQENQDANGTGDTAGNIGGGSEISIMVSSGARQNERDKREFGDVSKLHSDLKRIQGSKVKPIVLFFHFYFINKLTLKISNAKF